MNNIQNIYSYLTESKLTTIGYNYTHERLKNQFLSEIPHLKIDYFDPNISLISYTRDVKLNKLLYNETNGDIGDTIVVDFGDIHIQDAEFRYNKVMKMMENLRNYSVKYNKRVIITTPTHRNITTTIVGIDRSLLVTSDLVMLISDDKLKIIKNRFNIGLIEVKIHDKEKQKSLF